MVIHWFVCLSVWQFGSLAVGVAGGVLSGRLGSGQILRISQRELGRGLTAGWLLSFGAESVWLFLVGAWGVSFRHGIAYAYSGFGLAFGFWLLALAWHRNTASILWLSLHFLANFTALKKARALGVASRLNRTERVSNEQKNQKVKTETIRERKRKLKGKSNHKLKGTLQKHRTVFIFCLLRYR